MLNYDLDVIFFLVPNCPFYYICAKLSWCQTVSCQIVRVPNCLGAKLSGCQIVRVPHCLGAKLPWYQIVWVPNCPGAKLSGCQLSWCQIVRLPNCPFLTLGAKLSALTLGATLSGAKLCYNQYYHLRPAIYNIN